MNDKTGGPAFPAMHYDLLENEHGLTIRDYFAAKVLAAMIAQYPCQAIDNRDGGRLIDNEALSGDAYELADAMLKERAK